MSKLALFSVSRLSTRVPSTGDADFGEIFDLWVRRGVMNASCTERARLFQAEYVPETAAKGIDRSRMPAVVVISYNRYRLAFDAA